MNATPRTKGYAYSHTYTHSCDIADLSFLSIMGMPCYARQHPLEKHVWSRLLFLRMSLHINNNLIT